MADKSVLAKIISQCTPFYNYTCIITHILKSIILEIWSLWRRVLLWNSCGSKWFWLLGVTSPRFLNIFRNELSRLPDHFSILHGSDNIFWQNARNIGPNLPQTKILETFPRFYNSYNRNKLNFRSFFDEKWGFVKTKRIWIINIRDWCNKMDI